MKLLGYAHPPHHSTGCPELQYLAIAVGGAAGAVFRFWVSSNVYTVLGRGFPWGTLVVNVAGSLLIGLLSVLFVDRMSVSPELRAGLLIGFLGAFTTFSTFSMETLDLFEQGAFARGAANAVFSVLGCLGAAWLGVIAGRQL